MSWQQINQQYLWAALALVKQRLQVKVEPSSESSSELPYDPHETMAEAIEMMADEWDLTAALIKLCDIFDLSTFERDILLLCAGVELDATMGPLCALAQSDPKKNFPTLGLALSLFPDSHWSALTARAPLRRWRLIELHSGMGADAAAHAAQ